MSVMTRLIPAIAMGSVFVVANVALAQHAAEPERYVCGTGLIDDVHLVPDMSSKAGRSWTSIFRASSPAASSGEQRREGMAYVVVVRFDGKLYAGRAAANLPWNLDPTTFRVDEAVSICVSPQRMVLDRGDGTDFRARVEGLPAERKRP